jgi:hypothetical protein
MACYKFVAHISHFSFHCLKTITEFLDALFSGFWLGVMSRKSLDYSDELYYNRTKYYSEEKYNKSGLFDWEKPFIEKYFTGGHTILLIAAGAGRETLALTGLGFEVESYECNPGLIEVGNSLLEKSKTDKRIKYLPRNSVPAEVSKYDGIIIGWGAYSHIEGREKRLSFLNALKPFFQENTRLMISFIWITRKSWKDRMIINISNFFRFFRRKEKSEQGDRLVPDFIHYFDEEEIRKELGQSGFRIVDFSIKDYGCLVAGL